jgi:glycosyltransferase involved in cell wall biosynthesis
VAPTWSPPHHLFAFAFPKAYPGPVFSLISNTKDLEYFPRFAPNYIMVPLFASSWVNPDCFQPLPAEQKDIDMLMVANFGTFKRHHVLFKALRQIPAQLRVVLIGQEQDGRTAATIRAEARCYGVDNRLEIRANVPYGEVAATLPRAKVSVIMSRREGSCVVVAESLFAGTPVGLLESAEIGSKHFINPQTGRLLREHRLVEDLTEFITQSACFQPRQWAEQNISCTRSTAVLNDILKRYALEHGQDWTQDIALMCWRPDPRHVHSEDRERLEPARKDLETRFGLKLL